MYFFALGVALRNLIQLTAQQKIIEITHYGEELSCLFS
jgi:hypothetical protein